MFPSIQRQNVTFCLTFHHYVTVTLPRNRYHVTLQKITSSSVVPPGRDPFQRALSTVDRRQLLNKDRLTSIKVLIDRDNYIKPPTTRRHMISTWWNDSRGFNNNNNNSNNTLTFIAPISLETKLKGASIQNGYSISESLDNIPAVNICTDTPGGYGG